MRHPRLVAAGALGFLLYAALLVRTEPVEFLPSLAPAGASVQIQAPGLVADQVEELITRPVERALTDARGVAAMHSQSIAGLSSITLQFQPGADPGIVRQALTEGLVQTAGVLPTGVGAPRLLPLTSGNGPLLTLGFTSDRLTPIALHDLVEWTIRPRLLSSPGVAGVQLFGGQTRRIEVRARAGDLSDSDLGYGEVFDAVQRATGVTGAGFIETPNQRISIEPHGQARTATDVAAGQIQVVGNAPVRISDVADVVDAAAPAFGDATVQGRPGIILVIEGRYGANTLDATRALDAILASLTGELKRQSVVMTSDLDRPADVVTTAIRSIALELAIGAVLSAVLLVLFLRDARAALISLFTISLALLTTVAAMKLIGLSLDTMTLGGLAVALGLIVDDAVIDVEAILTELRRAESRHETRVQAIRAASLGIRAPVFYVTLMVAVSLLPIAFLGGVQGALLRPLAVSVILAALTALIVSALITPALAVLFLKHVCPEHDPPIVIRVMGGYDALLRGARPWWRPLAAFTGVVIVVAAISLPSFKRALLPVIHSDHLTATVVAPTAASIAVMSDYGTRITRDLLANRDVAGVAQMIGRAETSDQAFGPEHAVFSIALKPGLLASAQDRVKRQVEGVVAAYPGLQTQVRSGIGAQALPGDDQGEIQARIYGDDMDAVDRTSAQLANVLQATPLLDHVIRAGHATAPVMRVDLNFQRLAIYGLSAADVLNTVQTAFEGRTASQIYENGRAIAVAVTAQANLRQDPEAAGELLLRSSSGVSVPLKTVANVYLTDGGSMIEHDGGLRSERVSASMAGTSAANVRALEVKVAAAVKPPPGVIVQFAPPGSGFDPRHSLLINTILAGGGVIVLLLLAFGDARSTIIVLGSTLLSLIGGACAVFLMGGVLSLGAVMGFFALFGLSARNAALLVSRVDELVAIDKAPWSLETVRRAAHDRFSPIAISGVVVFIALLPLAVGSDRPGHEVLGPMAIVILGGLLTSTLMGLVLLPGLIWQVWRPKPGRAG